MAKKNLTLVGLDERAGKLLKDYIEHYGLLPEGKSYRITIEVGNYKSGHFFWVSSKSVRSDPCPSTELMTEEDWQEILGLPCFHNVDENSLAGRLHALVLEFKEAGEPIEVECQHQTQLNRIFQNLCLQYHVFRAGGPSWCPLWKIQKKL
ncbi:MAG: hypothetical protein WC794_02580 [Candidatus Doudnabacteria bacterium]|jgi:hypothetical protein